MQIVVLDGYTTNPGDVDWSPLETLGTLSVYDRTHPDMVAQRLRGADAVFVNKVRLDRETILSARSLKFIGVLATGYDVVDVSAAKERNIPVCNVPAYSTDAVAQHTIALLLAYASRIETHANLVRQGQWSVTPDFSFWVIAPTLLAGKTFGVYGTGRIGCKVAEIAAAFGMKVIGYSRNPKDDFAGRYVSKEELLSASDILSLHCPANTETTGMISKEALSLMKDGSILLNTARGSLIDETAVADALLSGKLAFYGADVASKEPIGKGNPLLNAPNCLITGHYAWTPKQMRQTLIDVSASNLRSFLEGQTIHSVW